MKWAASALPSTTVPAKRITAVSSVIMPLLGCLLQLVDAQHLKRELFIKRLAGAGAHLAQEVFFETDLGQCTHLPWLDQLTLRGGICGWATKARRHRRNRQGTPRSSSGFIGLAPVDLGGDVVATAVTMLSIMKPVLGTPTGTGVGPMGGMATHTPSE
jgi:hypothetical protein